MRMCATAACDVPSNVQYQGFLQVEPGESWPGQRARQMYAARAACACTYVVRGRARTSTKPRHEIQEFLTPGI